MIVVRCAKFASYLEDENTTNALRDVNIAIQDHKGGNRTCVNY